MEVYDFYIYNINLICLFNQKVYKLSVSGFNIFCTFWNTFQVLEFFKLSRYMHDGTSFAYSHVSSQHKKDSFLKIEHIYLDEILLK